MLLNPQNIHVFILYSQITSMDYHFIDLIRCLHSIWYHLFTPRRLNFNISYNELRDGDYIFRFCMSRKLIVLSYV